MNEEEGALKGSGRGTWVGIFMGEAAWRLGTEEYEVWEVDVEDVEEERLGVAGGLLGLFQLGLRISTFDDFHSSELTGRMALGSINADATVSLIRLIRGYVSGI